MTEEVKPPRRTLMGGPEQKRGRKLLTASEVSELLSLPISSVYEAVRQKRIGGVVKIGRIVRFDADKLEDWVGSGGQGLPGGWRQEEAA